MIAAWVLFSVMKAAPYNLAAATGLAIWRMTGTSPDRIDLAVMVLATLGATGTVCYALRRFRSDTAGLLLEALKASRPPTTGPGLRLVDPQGTGSSTPAAQHSVP